MTTSVPSLAPSWRPPEKKGVGWRSRNRSRRSRDKAVAQGVTP